MRQVGTAFDDKKSAASDWRGCGALCSVPLSLRSDETVHHQFSARLVEIDRQLRAVYGDDGARPELVVKHPRSRVETRGRRGLSVD